MQLSSSNELENEIIERLKRGIYLISFIFIFKKTYKYFFNFKIFTKIFIFKECGENDIKKTEEIKKDFESS